MRKIISIALILFILGVISGYATEDQAFNNVCAWAQDAYDQLVAQNIDVRVSEDAYVYNVENGKQIHIEGSFQPGNAYIFVVSGCNDASQVDMAVFDNNGNMLVAGESGGIDAIAIFNVDQTVDLVVVIQLTNTSAGKSSAHVGQIFMYVAAGK